MRIFTKDELISELETISSRGWIRSNRGSNDGAVGNTLEELLGIAENNLPIPNASEWELKAQRTGTSSLVTLCHIEPSPRTLKFVPKILLPNFGWPHKEAGKKYPIEEQSFRATLQGLKYTDRGFIVQIDNESKRIEINWDESNVDFRHSDWLEKVKSNVGQSGLDPTPYWGFDDLTHKMGTKLLNCFWVNAKTRKVNGQEEFWYHEAWMLQRFDFNLFLQLLENGKIYIDFDARTGHNHGTKFRIKRVDLTNLYSEKTLIFSHSDIPD